MNRRVYALASIATLVAFSAVLLNCEEDAGSTAPGVGGDGGFTLDSGRTDTGAVDSGTDTGATDGGPKEDADGGDGGNVGPIIPTIFGLDDTGKLIRFKSNAPGTLLGAATTITGLKATDAIVGIDFRPANGLLYGLGKLGHVYTIDKNTAAATAINEVAFAPAPSGTYFGVDVNPAVDRLRIHSDTQQNLRLHFADGGIVAVDGTLSYAAGDVNAAATPLVSGSAYSNSVSPAPATTVLYAIDTQTNALVFISPPNAGTLNTVGPLGVTPTDVAGFDIYGGISGDGGTPQLDKPMTAYAALVISNAVPELYTINLTTGAATKVGNINHAAVLIGIAVEP